MADTITINSKFVKFIYENHKHELAELLKAIVDYGAIAFITGYDGTWPDGQAETHKPSPEILKGNVIFVRGVWYGTSKSSLSEALEELGIGHAGTEGVEPTGLFKSVKDLNTQMLDLSGTVNTAKDTANAAKAAAEKNTTDIATNASKISENTSAIQANAAKIGTVSVPATITEGVTLYDENGNQVSADKIVAGVTYYKNPGHTEQAVVDTDYTLPIAATGIYNYIDNSIKTVELTWQELS